MSYVARAAGLALGYAADAVFGDPRRGHPVAGFGRAAAALERRIWADSRSRGTAYTLACVAGAIAVGQMARRAAGRGPLAETAITAAATWAVLGGRSLAAEGKLMHGLLASSDLDGARQRLSHLAGRNPEGLDEGQLARATVESLAENTSDAVVAPLLWGAVAGVPGLLGYRAANTLDAMVGHRSARYARFGWCSARFDDIVNLAPSRVSAALAAGAAPLVGGSLVAAVRVWQRDAGKHPSPNAGQVEASFAGALGVTLGGTNTYGDRVEHRGALGDGPPPHPADIARAVRLSRAVGLASLVVAVVVTAAIGAATTASRARAGKASAKMARRRRG
ncbi:MAG: adenosylcobinamide-phosphate synthase [Micromonosporaceae bacterium]|nr:adenosylcobinamide-phosphate synthase [Micromonosporaceae bacterium]